MGYESKLYIVRKYKNGFEPEESTGKYYASVIAKFDMCKFYDMSDVLRHEPETDCYFYADDGNTKVLEDCYGEALTEATVTSVIELLESIVAKGVDYWRIFPLLSALKVFEEHGDNDIVVLHYGY